MTVLPDVVVQRLALEQTAWCTTLRPDGSPHTTPVWFWFSANVWWIASAAHNVKVRNVIGDPRVALCLEDGRDPVVAEGRAHVHRNDVPRRVTTAFAQKYDGWDVSDTVPDGPRVLLEVQVVRWLFAGRGR